MGRYAAIASRSSPASRKQRREIRMQEALGADFTDFNRPAQPSSVDLHTDHRLHSFPGSSFNSPDPGDCSSRRCAERHFSRRAFARVEVSAAFAPPCQIAAVGVRHWPGIQWCARSTLNEGRDERLVPRASGSMALRPRGRRAARCM